MINIEKPSHTKIKIGDGFLFILTGSTGQRVCRLNLCYLGDKSHNNIMRIPISCSDFKLYIINPKIFLPKKPICIRDPKHKTRWNNTWKRYLIIDHVNKVIIIMFRGYCTVCGETISYWPEFILPYQPELVETHEQVVIEHIEGTPANKIAEKIGYDAQTVRRWIKRILGQAQILAPKAIPYLIKEITCELLPLWSTLAKELIKELLAWLYKYAKTIGFPRSYRLMGLCNLMSKGQWIIWGGAIGRCKYSRGFIESLPG